MKWFFAVNDVSLQLERDFWQSMILAAVRSARQHTNLAPHLLFDGDDDPFLPRPGAARRDRRPPPGVDL